MYSQHTAFTIGLCRHLCAGVICNPEPSSYAFICFFLRKECNKVLSVVSLIVWLSD